MGGHEHGAVEGVLKGPRGTLACFNVHRVSSFEVQSPAGPVSQSFKPWRAEHTRAEVLGFEGVRDPGGVTVLGEQATCRVRWKLVLGSWWGGSEWEGKGPRG